MRAYGALLLLTLLATVGAVLTLIPASGASYQNLLGYRSLCTFAPAATLYCCAIAGASCVVRRAVVKRKGFRAVPSAIVSLLLVAAVASTFWFTSVKSRYVDAPTTATPSEVHTDE
jgi:hypothetical protein